MKYFKCTVLADVSHRQVRHADRGCWEYDREYINGLHQDIRI